MYVNLTKLANVEIIKFIKLQYNVKVIKRERVLKAHVQKS